jgi:hypothetical protein
MPIDCGKYSRKLATHPFVVEHAGGPVASVKTGTRAAVSRATRRYPRVLRQTAATWMARADVPMEQIVATLLHARKSGANALK